MRHVDLYRERAGIAQFDGCLSQAAAEALALQEVQGMYASFTGTRQGCTPAQLATLRKVLGSERLRIVRLCHGGAVGADVQAHQVARELGLEVWVRPSGAGSWEGAVRVAEPEPPLDRNPKIVADGRGLLVACPAAAAEQERGGTWATVRAARKMGVDVLLVLPDGSTRSERNRPADLRASGV